MTDETLDGLAVAVVQQLMDLLSLGVDGLEIAHNLADLTHDGEAVGVLV